MIDNQRKRVFNVPLIEYAIMWAESNQSSYDLVGKKFMDFADIDNNGAEHRLGEYAGKGNYVVLDFWASWCTPGIAEMPKLKTAQELYGDKKLQIVGVSLDGNERKWKEAIEKHSLNWTQLGNIEDQKLYHIRAIPRLILLYLLNVIEPGNNFTSQINWLFIGYPSIYKRALNFPNNWEIEPLWQ